jgi:hypothetical protein
VLDPAKITEMKNLVRQVLDEKATPEAIPADDGKEPPATS